MDREIIDKLVYVAIVNGYTLGKDSKELILNDIDPDDPAHRHILFCMDMVRNISDIQPKISLKKRKRFSWYKLKKRYKVMKYIKLTKENGKNIDEFISDIEVPNNAEGGFAEGWNMYYEG